MNENHRAKIVEEIRAARAILDAAWPVSETINSDLKIYETLARVQLILPILGRLREVDIEREVDRIAEWFELVNTKMDEVLDEVLAAHFPDFGSAWIPVDGWWGQPTSHAIHIFRTCEDIMPWASVCGLVDNIDPSLLVVEVRRQKDPGEQAAIVLDIPEDPRRRCRLCSVWANRTPDRQAWQ